MHHFLSKSLSCAALVIMVAVVPGPYDQAAAREDNCALLFERINKSGELPVIRIDTAKQIVHVRLAGQRCSEPIDVWTARKWQPPPPKTAEPAPAPPPPKEETVKPSAPLETHPMFKEQAAPEQSLPTAPEPEAEKTPADTEIKAAGAACTKKLDEFWAWGKHIVEGVRYQLIQVFTIDLNGDGTTDNVGFKLTSSSMPDMVIRYISAPGSFSARSIPSLRLPDDVSIAELCFGQVALQEPKPKPKKQPRKLFEPVDLAKEMKAKQEQSEQSESATNGSSKATLFRWLTYAGIGLFLILAGAVAFVVLQRRRGGKSGEEDDDEYDEERDGDDADEDEIDDEDKG